MKSKLSRAECKMIDSTNQRTVFTRAKGATRYGQTAATVERSESLDRAIGAVSRIAGAYVRVFARHELALTSMMIDVDAQMKREADKAGVEYQENDLTFIKMNYRHCKAGMSAEQLAELQATFEDEKDEYGGGPILEQPFPRTVALIKAFLAA